MTHRHTTTVVAGIATLLATMPLAAIFESWAWLLNAILTVIVVMGTATIARVLRAPAGVQVLAMMGALLLLVTWRFPSGHEIAGLIPTAETFTHFRELFVQSGQEIRNSAVPVPDLHGLLLLAMAGIGLVAVLVDLAAVGIRRPALAGLPMLALYSVPVAVLREGLPFLYFAAGCLGYLWLLVGDSVDRVRRFGRRFSGEGRDVDLWEPSPLSAAGRRLGVVAITAAILVPLAVPPMSPTLLTSFGPRGGGLGGGFGPGDAPVTTVNMNALLSDSLTQNEIFEMALVRTNDPSPYYVRLGAAERLDEAGFHTDLPTGGGIAADEFAGALPAGPVTAAGPYQATVEVTGLSLGLAPVYGRLTDIAGLDGNWSYDENLEEVWSRTRNINRSTYTIQFARLTFDPDLLRAAAPIPPSDVGARALTDVPPSDFVADLVDDLIAGETNQYDRVRALYEHFHPDNGYRYSLTTVEGDSGSPIVDFLRNKRGFCVQYAAALAWMVRQAGYPARVAFGFTRGSGFNGVYSLTNRNLHAWTEVYFPDFGWVPFDATPGGAVVGSVRPAWAPEIADGSQTPVPDPTATGGPLPVPSDLPGAGGNPDAGNPGASSGFTINVWYVVAGTAALLVLALLVGPSLQRRALRRRRRAVSGTVIALTPPLPSQEDLVTDPAAMSDAQRDAHNAWAELLDLMIDYGVLLDPAETPRATASRLSGTPQLGTAGRPHTAVLARAEERARYAPAPVRPTNLDEAVRQAREAFADNASRWQRISAAVFPRSVLLRWRLGYYTFVARTARRVGRIRDSLLLVPLRERRRR